MRVINIPSSGILPSFALVVCPPILNPSNPYRSWNLPSFALVVSSLRSYVPASTAPFVGCLVEGLVAQPEEVPYRGVLEVEDHGGVGFVEAAVLGEDVCMYVCMYVFSDYSSPHKAACRAPGNPGRIQGASPTKTTLSWERSHRAPVMWRRSLSSSSQRWASPTLCLVGTA